MVRTRRPAPREPRPARQTLLGPGLLVVVSASLGIVAELDARAARILFAALTGVLLFMSLLSGWTLCGGAAQMDGVVGGSVSALPIRMVRWREPT
jgi:hypothetical protein